MSKRRIPSDTKYFHYYNANPKNKHTADCVVRAISLGLDKRYKEVLFDLTELSWETGYDPTSKQVIDKYLKQNGFIKMKQPRWGNGTKFTGKEFCTSIKRTAIISIGSHHLSCIKDGKIWDIWDCSGRCVGNYWIKD